MMTQRYYYLAHAGAALVVLALLAGCNGDGGMTEPGPETQIVTVEVSPAADTLVALGQTAQLTATARDADGDVVSGVTFTWSSGNAGVVSVDQTGAATAVSNGVAQITATAAGVSGNAQLRVAQEVEGVTVTPSTATLTTIGATQQFSAEASDANGNVVQGIKFLWQSSNPSVAVVDTTGLATVQSAGVATVTAAARGVPGNAVLTVDQTIAQLGFLTQPSDVVAGEALDPAIRVEVQDADGNRVAHAELAITLSLGTNPGGATLNGTRTVTSTNGVATFSGLWLDKAAGGYTLTASTPGGVTDATSTSFATMAAAPAQLALATQPTNATAGVAISPAVEVEVQDAFGNLVSAATDAVTIALDINPGGANLQGTLTVNAVAGVATFSDLVIERAASGYTLVASAGALTEAASASFAIDPAAASQLGFITEPTDTEGTVTISPAVRVAIQDAFGNTVPTATDAVSVSLPAGGSLLGTTTKNAVAGVAEFDDLSIVSPGDYTLLASAGGAYPPATSATFEVHLTFVSTSAGGGHTCGVTVAAAAYCWGENVFGELGDGSTTDRAAPVLVGGGLSFAAVSAGGSHTCGVTTADVAYCWGSNSSDQLGDGTGMASSTPVAVAGGHSFDRVSAGGFHTCAVTTADVAFCWGSNSSGQVGDGTTTPRALPVQVSGGLSFADIDAGSRHTCAVTSANAAYCWGENNDGQLGDASTTDRTSPVPVAGGLSFAQVSAGSNHTCGLTTVDLGLCWGRNVEGQLGDGTNNNKTTPSTTSGVQDFSDISAGGSQTCAVTITDVTYCWGLNVSGQLGDGTTDDSNEPVAVFGGLTFTDVSAGSNHSCGLTGAGVAYCWGNNFNGQLGDGTGSNSLTPSRVVQ